MRPRLAFVWFVLAFLARAQNVPHLGKECPPTPEPAPAPKMSCGALRSLTGYEFTIIPALAQRTRR